MTIKGTDDRRSMITLTITFDSEEEAANAGRALKIDDDDFVRTSIEGCVVRGEIKANSVEGVRRAADDWLACMMAVSKKK